MRRGNRFAPSQGAQPRSFSYPRQATGQTRGVNQASQAGGAGNGGLRFVTTRVASSVFNNVRGSGDWVFISFTQRNKTLSFTPMLFQGQQV